MFIKREEYEQLYDRAKLVDELEKECQRLAELISAKVENCQIGIWCKDCIYLEEEKAEIKGYLCGCVNTPDFSFVKECAGKVYYCSKYLKEMCPEFCRKFNH